mmetsp:Transcript_46594/g.105290  ORF Transcript_46594/g.105290 Transcript_46594/m.105290 type:complete len:254 (-) Transcript_46594:453-1214(-)
MAHPGLPKRRGSPPGGRHPGPLLAADGLRRPRHGPQRRDPLQRHRLPRRTRRRKFNHRNRHGMVETLSQCAPRVLQLHRARPRHPAHAHLRGNGRDLQAFLVDVPREVGGVGRRGQGPGLDAALALLPRDEPRPVQPLRPVHPPTRGAQGKDPAPHVGGSGAFGFLGVVRLAGALHARVPRPRRKTRLRPRQPHARWGPPRPNLPQPLWARHVPRLRVQRGGGRVVPHAGGHHPQHLVPRMARLVPRRTAVSG